MQRAPWLALAVAVWMGAAQDGTSHHASIERLLSADPVARKAFEGICVVRLSDGRLLYSHDAERLFTPASNTKLVTTALALTRLGPDYRFTTRLVAEGQIDSGVLKGDLVLVGGGDPALSARTYPYQPAARPLDALAAMEQFASAAASHGIRAIEGRILGDDSRYPWEPYPDGWSIDDAIWDYGAPVSALTFNDNSVTLTVRPASETGGAAALSFTPALEPFATANRVVTAAGAGSEIEIERLPHSGVLRVTGHIGTREPALAVPLAVDEPALYAARALRDALTRAGISVRGEPAARHRGEPSGIGQEIAQRESPPLSQIVQVVNKASQNLHAEILLCEVARVRGKDGGRKAALAEMKQFLAEIGIEESQYAFEDGSGLSRMTLISPAALVKLLTYMHNSPHRGVWMAALPVGGVDGTLAARFAGHPEAAAIRAKTGSLAHVRALSGYAQSASNGLLAFSVVLNNSSAPSAELGAMLDKIGLELLK